MKYNINRCPACASEMVITKYHCPKCHTEVSGTFRQDKFSKLTTEQKDFIEIFVKKRGSIKEIEKELGVSYPTVRNKLDNVIEALGHHVEKDYSRLEILQRLDDGELSAEEAAALIQDLNGGEL